MGSGADLHEAGNADIEALEAEAARIVQDAAQYQRDALREAGRPGRPRLHSPRRRRVRIADSPAGRLDSPAARRTQRASRLCDYPTALSRRTGRGHQGHREHFWYVL